MFLPSLYSLYIKGHRKELRTKVFSLRSKTIPFLLSSASSHKKKNPSIADLPLTGERLPYRIRAAKRLPQNGASFSIEASFCLSMKSPGRVTNDERSGSIMLLITMPNTSAMSIDSSFWSKSPVCETTTFVPASTGMPLTKRTSCWFAVRAILNEIASEA